MDELERLDVTASNTNGRSYMFAHLKPLIDKTGEAQRADRRQGVRAGGARSRLSSMPRSTMR